MVSVEGRGGKYFHGAAFNFTDGDIPFVAIAVPRAETNSVEHFGQGDGV